MKRHITWFAAAVLLLGLQREAQAQSVPPNISFVGNLTAAGGPVGGQHTFRFALYDAPAGGTVAWSETLTNLPVNNGLVYATLGATTPFTSGILNGAPLHLEITVDGTVLTPRVPVLSVPYALRAGAATSAERLGNLLPSEVQRRVTGACAGSSALQSIDPSGTVSCVAIPPAGITGVTASAPLASSGGAAPNLSIATANASSSGALSAADWSTFNSKVSSVGVTAPLLSTGGQSPQLSLGVVGVSNGGTGNGAALNGVVLGGNPMTAVAASGAGQLFRRNSANSAYDFIGPAGGGDPVGTGRTIGTNSTLSGGGDLSGDRTLGLNLNNPNTWTAAQTFSGSVSTALVNNVKLVRIRADCPGGPCNTLIASSAGLFAELRLTGPNEFTLVDLGSIVNFVAYINGARLAGHINNASTCPGLPPLCSSGANGTCRACRIDTQAQGASAKDLRIIFGQPGSTSSSIAQTTEVTLLQDISGNGTTWGGYAISSQDQPGL